MRVKRWAWWPLCAWLCGCQLGQVSAPPLLPTGVVSGVVTGGQPLAGAPVEIFANGVMVGGTRTDDSGRFAVDLAIPSATLAVRTPGVAYVRAADNAEVVSGPLQAQIAYQQGQNATAAVSPFSTVASAIAAYLEGTGIGTAAALSDADQELAEWIGVSPLTVPQFPVAGTSTLSPAAELGLALGGLSFWAHAQGQTTAVVTALMLSDIAHNGLLDGAGTNGPLQLGTEPLSANAYRQGLADGVLQAAAASGLLGTPQTPLARAITAYADTLAISTSPLFGGAAVVPFGQAPISVTLSPQPHWTRGTLTLAGTVSDPLSLPVSVTLAIDGTASQNVVTPGPFAFSINTAAFADGMHSLAVAAADGAGELGQAETEVGFDNGGPQACVRSFIAGSPLGTLQGNWSDPAGITRAIFAGGPLHILPNGTWSVITLPLFVQPARLMLSDAAGNVRTFVWNVRLGQGGCG